MKAKNAEDMMLMTSAQRCAYEAHNNDKDKFTTPKGWNSWGGDKRMRWMAWFKHEYDKLQSERYGGDRGD